MSFTRVERRSEEKEKNDLITAVMRLIFTLAWLLYSSPTSLVLERGNFISKWEFHEFNAANSSQVIRFIHLFIHKHQSYKREWLHKFLSLFRKKRVFLELVQVNAYKVYMFISVKTKYFCKITMIFLEL